jgi:twinkle protein
MAEFLHHGPCPSCGSTDACATYSDGGTYCFSCKRHTKGDENISEEIAKPLFIDWSPAEGEPLDLPSRGLKKATLEFWHYRIGENCHIANYFDPSTRDLVAQKIRRAGKQFSINGNGKDMPLYGQWLWSGGKHLVITEGEIDALSMSQAFDLKWPVVSLPNGAQSAAKSIAEHYEWLDRFDRIVLMFDMDRPGREAVETVAPLLPPGKACIALLPKKDANEVLVQHGPGRLVSCFWDAQAWRPDGIVDGKEFDLARVKQAAVQGFPLPYPRLQEMVLGTRKGELTLWTAGSGIGKSTIVREIGYDLHENHGCFIGNVFLEENNVKTAQAYVAIHNSVPLGRLRFQPHLLDDTSWRASLEKVVQRGMWFYNHFGSLESKNLITKLRYMATVCKVDFILLDHISIVTSGLESSKEGERKDIDILMTRLRSLIEETGVGVIAIVHLKRTEKNFNEGEHVALSDLRGSASLEQLSDNVYALERNQQGASPTKALIRVLKCRELGETGEADTLNYNRATGRLELSTADDFPDEDL